MYKLQDSGRLSANREISRVITASPHAVVAAGDSARVSFGTDKVISRTFPTHLETHIVGGGG